MHLKDLPWEAIHYMGMGGLTPESETARSGCYP